VLALAALFLPLYFLASAVEEENVPLIAEIEALQVTLTAPAQVPSAEQTLSAQRQALQVQLSALEGIPQTLEAGHVDWAAVMLAVRRYDPASIRLTGFVQDGDRLTLEGKAIAESAALDYASVLEDTRLFARVHVQTITLSPPPTATAIVLQNGTPVMTLADPPLPFVFTLTLELQRTVDELP
jgi:hypothetical protein